MSEVPLQRSAQGMQVLTIPPVPSKLIHSTAGASDLPQTSLGSNLTPSPLYRWTLIVNHRKSLCCFKHLSFHKARLSPPPPPPRGRAVY